MGNKACVADRHRRSERSDCYRFRSAESGKKIGFLIAKLYFPEFDFRIRAIGILHASDGYVRLYGYGLFDFRNNLVVGL